MAPSTPPRSVILSNSERTASSTKSVNSSIINEPCNGFSFFVKPNDERFLIYEVRGVISYIEDLNGCLQQRNEIAKEISEIFEEAKKSEESFKVHTDPSGKSTKNKIKFTFNSGDEIQLVCSDWEENLRIKNNWGEGLSVIITTNGVLNWLRG